VKTVEITHSKTLKINTKLNVQQEYKLLVMLKRNIASFAWDYKDIRCIHPSIFIHHIYIKEYFGPIRQPQRDVNLSLKYIVKQELKNLLDASFSYLISDSEWVSPLVIVHKIMGNGEYVWIIGN